MKILNITASNWQYPQGFKGTSYQPLLLLVLTKYVTEIKKVRALPPLLEQRFNSRKTMKEEEGNRTFFFLRQSLFVYYAMDGLP